MDDIIQKVIDFEKKAQDIVSEARVEQQAHEETMNAEIDAFRTKITDENNDRIKNYITVMKKETDEAVKHLEDAAKLKTAQMQRVAASQKDEWIDYLYAKIIDGEI